MFYINDYYGSAGTSSSGGLVVNLPAYNTGDLLLAFAANDTSVSWTASAGWTKITDNANGTNTQGAIWARIATGSDSLTITGEANDICVLCYAITNHRVTNVSQIVVGTASTGSTVSVDPPNCDASSLANSVLLYIAFTAFGTGFDASTLEFAAPAFDSEPVLETGFYSEYSTAGTSGCTSHIQYWYAVSTTAMNPSSADTNTAAPWVSQTICFRVNPQGETAFNGAGSLAAYNPTTVTLPGVGKVYAARLLPSDSEGYVVGESGHRRFTFSNEAIWSETVWSGYSGGLVPLFGSDYKLYAQTIENVNYVEVVAQYDVLNKAASTLYVTPFSYSSICSPSDNARLSYKYEGVIIYTEPRGYPLYGLYNEGNVEISYFATGTRAGYHDGIYNLFFRTGYTMCDIGYVLGGSATDKDYTYYPPPYTISAVLLNTLDRYIQDTYTTQPLNCTLSYGVLHPAVITDELTNKAYIAGGYKDPRFDTAWPLKCDTTLVHDANTETISTHANKLGVTVANGSALSSQYTNKGYIFSGTVGTTYTDNSPHASRTEVLSFTTGTFSYIVSGMSFTVIPNCGGFSFNNHSTRKLRSSGRGYLRWNDVSVRAHLAGKGVASVTVHVRGIGWDRGYRPSYVSASVMALMCYDLSIDTLKTISAGVTSLASYTRNSTTSSADKGYWLGGSSTICDKYSFETQTYSNNYATSPTTQSSGVGVNTSSTGFVAGGNSSGILAVNFSTDAVSTHSVSLATSNSPDIAAQSLHNGYFIGGNDASPDVIEVFNFASNTVQAAAQRLIYMSSTSSYRLCVFSGEAAYIPQSTNSISTTGVLKFSYDTHSLSYAALMIGYNDSYSFSGVSGTYKGVLFGYGSIPSFINGIDFASETSYASAVAYTTTTLNMGHPVREVGYSKAYSTAYIAGGSTPSLYGKVVGRAQAFNNVEAYFCGGVTTTAIHNRVDGFAFNTETGFYINYGIPTSTAGMAGVSSGNSGYFAGGRDGPNVPQSAIYRFIYNSFTGYALSATLTLARSYLASCEGSLNGYFFGGFNSTSRSTVDRLTYSTETTTAAGSSITASKYLVGGMQNDTHGFIVGGINDSSVINSNLYVMSFSTHTIVSTTNALRQRSNTGGLHSSNNGYLCAGFTDYGYGYNSLCTEFDKFTLSTSPTNTTLGGSFTEHGQVGVSGFDKGYYTAHGSQYSAYKYSTKLTFDTETYASVYGYLHAHRYDVGAVVSKGLMGRTTQNGVGTLTPSGYVGIPRLGSVTMNGVGSIANIYPSIVGKSYSRAWTSGGVTSGSVFTNKIYRLNPVNLSTTLLTATLKANRGYGGNVDTTNKGYNISGTATATTTTTEIEGIYFYTDTKFDPAMALATGLYNMFSWSRGDKGYVAGGAKFAAPLRVSTIHDFIFAVDTTSVMSNTITVARDAGASVQTPDRGYGLGGYTTAGVSEIDGFQFAPETVFNPTQTLSSARYRVAGLSGPSAGYALGGEATKVPDKILFATNTISTFGATLLYAFACGMSFHEHGYLGSSSSNLTAVVRVCFYTDAYLTITGVYPAAGQYNCFVNVHKSENGVEVEHPAYAAPQGVGRIYAYTPSQATLNGVGTLFAVPYLNGQATLDGAGSASVIAARNTRGTALLVGIGSLDVVISSDLRGSTTLNGVGSATVLGKLTTTASTTLTGVGSGTISGTIVEPQHGAATCDGVGSISVKGGFVWHGSATTSGQGTASVTGNRDRSGSTTANAVGLIVPRAGLLLAGASVLEYSAGTLTIAARVVPRYADSVQIDMDDSTSFIYTSDDIEPILLEETYVTVIRDS